MTTSARPSRRFLTGASSRGGYSRWRGESWSVGEAGWRHTVGGMGASAGSVCPSVGTSGGGYRDSNRPCGILVRVSTSTV
eukprot:1194811-Prorocentrum_minimum.AAC.6